MLNPLLYQFNYALEKYGYNVTINNLDEVKVLLKEYNELNNMKEYKFMLVKNELVKQGDIIKIFDDNWI
ncbi:MAG TPA: hypothetical protein VK982_07790, partial [Bacteroidales bacterium]|nr:hypothetical protein [Bacteroidales bacterium]